MTQKQFTLEDFPLYEQQQQEQQFTLNVDNTPQMEDCQDLGMFTFSNRSRKMSLDNQYFSFNQEIQNQQFAEQQYSQFFQLQSQQNTNNFLFTLPEPTQQHQQQFNEKSEEFILQQDSSNSDEQQMTPFDLSNPFVSFEQQQQQQQQQDDEVKFEDVQDLSSKKKSSSMRPFITIITKKQPKKRGNYDKNICRYLTRKVIRCFASNEYKEKVMSFAQFDEELYFEATEFFLRRIEKITGFRVLKQYLQYKKLAEIPIEDEQSRIERVYCIVFKKFYLWFLKERMNRYILNGKMDDKQMYIKYKNEVMLNYSDTLDSWTSNKNLKKKERRK